MIEPPEVLVLGPYIRNMRREARARSCPGGRGRRRATPRQSPTADARRPRIGAMNSVGRKPVLQMMQSSSRSRPSAVRIPVGVSSCDRLGDQLDVGTREGRAGSAS